MFHPHNPGTSSRRGRHMHCCARLHVPGARAFLFMRTTPSATVCGQGLRKLPASQAHVEHKLKIDALQLLTCYKSGLAPPLGWEGWVHRNPLNQDHGPRKGKQADEWKTGRGKSQTGNRTVMTTDRGARAAPAAAAAAGQLRVSLPSRSGLSEKATPPLFHRSNDTSPRLPRRTGAVRR